MNLNVDTLVRRGAPFFVKVVVAKSTSLTGKKTSKLTKATLMIGLKEYDLNGEPVSSELDGLFTLCRGLIRDKKEYSLKNQLDLIAAMKPNNTIVSVYEPGTFLVQKWNNAGVIRSALVCEDCGYGHSSSSDDESSSDE